MNNIAAHYFSDNSLILKSERIEDEPRFNFIIFLFFFAAIIQYDVIIGSVRQNYLVISLPLSLAIAFLCQLKLFGRIVLEKKGVQLFCAIQVFGIWCLIANDFLSLLKFLLFELTIINCLLFATLTSRFKQMVCETMEFFIFLNVAIISSQFLFYLLSGGLVDFHNLVFPFSRQSEISAVHGFGFARFNGLHLEPGSYSAAMGIIGLCYLGLSKHPKLWLIGWLILTILLTRSASGLIYAIALSVVIYLLMLKASVLVTLLMTPLLAAFSIAAIIVSGAIDYITNRFFSHASLSSITASDGSTRIKLENWNYLMESDGWRKFIGSGFMHIDCSTCAFVNSNGAAFAIWFFFGAFGILFCLWLLYLGFRRSLVAFILICTLLLSRHAFNQIAFWLPIFLIYHNLEFGRKLRE